MHTDILTHTPHPALIAFFKSHGKACLRTVPEIEQAAQGYLAEARALAAQVPADTSIPAQLVRADRVSALCAAALYTANGFGAVADEAAFASPEALAVLTAELELSPATSLPLAEVRQRAATLREGGPVAALDTFLAHQAAGLASALVAWSDEHLAEARLS